MAYADPTQLLLSMAGGDNDEVGRALQAAAHDIDSALASAPGGYPTPVDTSALTSEEGLRFAAKLVAVNQALAGCYLSQGTRGGRGSSARVMKDCREAKAWLDRVRAGAELIPGMTTTAAGGIGVVGPATWDHTHDLLDLARVTN